MLTYPSIYLSDCLYQYLAIYWYMYVYVYIYTYICNIYIYVYIYIYIYIFDIQVIQITTGGTSIYGRIWAPEKHLVLKYKQMGTRIKVRSF